jgi:hypothetical protein
MGGNIKIDLEEFEGYEVNRLNSVACLILGFVLDSVETYRCNF